MRILFTFTGGRGHAEPLVPIARAAQAESHPVAFAGRQSMVQAIRELGFETFAVGPTETPTRKPLVELDPAREDRVLRDSFAGWVARLRAREILTLCYEWAPDVIVCDEIDVGAMVAAERAGVPHASVLVIAAGSFVRPELVRGPLDALRAEHDLPPDPELAMLSRYLVLSPFPPSFRDPAFPLPATAHLLRPPALEPSPNEGVPSWLTHEPGAPMVYVTLGTVFNIESGDLFRRILDGFRGLPVEVVVTVGDQIDPDELAPIPENARVERFVPQSVILPRSSAVVCHGGSGSVSGALAHGLPLVVFPMGADQPLNAARCEELGVGVALDAVRATPALVRDAVSTVLSEPSFRTAAARIRDEAAASPGPEHALTLLERLETERRPLPRV
jgi:UDP:flavonoid glycosyltransferase YjiC (YdhE family)